MKILSWNVHGLEDEYKKTLIGRDLSVGKANWVALHETTLRMMDNFVVNQVCGRGD